MWILRRNRLMFFAQSSKFLNSQTPRHIFRSNLLGHYHPLYALPSLLRLAPPRHRRVCARALPTGKGARALRSAGGVRQPAFAGASQTHSCRRSCPPGGAPKRRCARHAGGDLTRRACGARTALEDRQRQRIATVRPCHLHRRPGRENAPGPGPAPSQPAVLRPPPPPPPPSGR